ncbi:MULTISPECIES: DUF4214 domain-containing protein [Rubrivivax]|uniref:DUF4214 domain-containing protein n=1 Tax=Rubrivivax benzoatilyticus TaxID=316997 RepID=A0ABX0HSC3_9BURK|nr:MULTISPECIES: DUF4214 domain-containing protein [Rubrivivax]EGJ09957.1 methyltransferase FkbM family protein [Rubrivivax benzoatilyticus JA2 = ATCC BAA-35]NHK97942.1 DUF4214 domain-containing protein [Rubrivivax benzoatilyticus]NHL23444.1 DUF4214 domain-containing protein [Rubrivivax benzoatilyticus]
MNTSPTPSIAADELLSLFDEAFVDALYRRLLGREPDPAGRQSHLEQIRLGYPKTALIAHFLDSAEGKRHGARVEGLDARAAPVPGPDPSRLGGWLRRQLQASGMATASELNALENRLGRLLSPADADANQDNAVAQAVATAPDPDELYRRIVVLTQAVTRLEGRLDAFGDQMQRLERLLPGLWAPGTSPSPPRDDPAP